MTTKEIFERFKYQTFQGHLFFSNLNHDQITLIGFSDSYFLFLKNENGFIEPLEGPYLDKNYFLKCHKSVFIEKLRTKKLLNF